MPLQQLRRIRWAVRATLLFGVAASVAANVLHALPNPISQGIAAWPPLALLLAVELISRIPMHRRSLAFARLASTAAIASIAAWVSYWHMVGVAARYGENEMSAYLLPLSVDGLIVVASVSLVELAGRIRAYEQELERRQDARAAAQVPPAPAPAPVAPPMVLAPAPIPAPPVPAPTPQVVEPVAVEPVAVKPAIVEQPAVAAAPATETNPLNLPDFAWTADTAALTTSAKRSTPQVVRPTTSNASSRTTATASVPAKPAAADAPAQPTKAIGSAKVTKADVPKQRRSVAETAALVAEIQADEPTITLPDLAERLGISVSRLRAVRREAAQLDQAAA